MKQIIISLISLGSVLALTACSSMNNRGFLKDDTQSYKKEPPIEQRTIIVPQNLSSRNVQDYYEVPTPAAEAVGVEPALAPPGSGIMVAKPRPAPSQQDRIKNAENAKIQGHTTKNIPQSKTIDVYYPQAWSKISKVLTGLGYEIMDKNQEKDSGTYYVIDRRHTGGKAQLNMPIYQVHLKKSGNATVISITPPNPALQDILNKS